MLTKELIGIIAVVIGILGNIPYIVQILKGNQKPQKVSWLIWAVVGSLVFFSYDYSGADNTIWVPLVYAIGPFIIFLLSLKYGTGGWTKIDKIALSGALFGFIIWFITGNPLLGLLAGSLIDIMGFLPIIKEVYLNPDSEDKLSWGLWFGANTLNLFALESFTDLHIYFVPLYLFIGSGIIFLLLFRRKLKK